MNGIKSNEILKGDVYYADLRGSEGSEQSGVRPVLIIQNNTGNKFSPCVICAPLTTQIKKNGLPTHVKIDANKSGLPRDSVAMIEQPRTLDKKRLGSFMGRLTGDCLSRVDSAIAVSFGLPAVC
jgi:mRNA interferase MazF